MTEHSHYFADVSTLEKVDFYRLAELYGIVCPNAQHVFKKSLAMGARGAKDLRRDWQDVLDTAKRKLEMLDEDALRARAEKPVPICTDADEARQETINQKESDGRRAEREPGVIYATVPGA